MRLFMVDESKCKRDGLCVSECPRGIIQMTDTESFPSPVEGADQICTRCGHCVSVCPHGAFVHSEMKPDECPPYQKELALNPEHVEHLLRSRRSIRSYKDKEIEKGDLEKVIGISRYAPTGMNLQEVEWIAINSRKEVQRLSGLAVDWMRDLIGKKDPVAEAYGMPGIVNAWEAGKDIICRGAPGLVLTHAPKDGGSTQTDCTIALTYLTLAAPSFGLGTCWAGYFMIAAMQWIPLQEALPLPDGNALFGAMMIGHPKYKYQRFPLRKEPDITWVS